MMTRGFLKSGIHVYWYQAPAGRRRGITCSDFHIATLSHVVARIARDFKLFGMLTLIATVYFNPGTTIQQILAFFTKYQHHLDFSSSTGLPIPMILCGDFDCNVKDHKTKTQLCTVLLNRFSLALVTDPQEPTTPSGSCIDLVFTRDLKLECINSVCYFSYHRPITVFISE